LYGVLEECNASSAPGSSAGADVGRATGEVATKSSMKKVA
jgi:hypothetical protein